MKMTIEELQEEQKRNAAEAKAIYWYPGEFNGVRQWLEAIILDITLMDRRHVGETHSRRLRPDIVLEERAPKYITVEAAKPPQGKNEEPGYVYSIDTDGGCTPKKLSYASLTKLSTPSTPTSENEEDPASTQDPTMPVEGEAQILNPAYITDDQWDDMCIIVCGLIRKRIPPTWHHIVSSVGKGDVQEMMKAVYGKAYSDPKTFCALIKEAMIGLELDVHSFDTTVNQWLVKMAEGFSTLEDCEAAEDAWKMSEDDFVKGVMNLQ